MAEAPYRVAIADDSADIRYMLRLLLELDQAFTVVGEAGTGAEALALVESERPDAIILDLAMPEMDGLEAIRKIRHKDAGTKVVVLSGFEAATMANQALQRGASAYIPKGTKPGELVAKLKDICRRDEALDAEEPAGVGLEPVDMSGDDLVSVLPIVTHELRNQAVVIEGMTRTVLSSLGDLQVEKIQQALQSVARNAAQMHALIDGLSDLRRVQGDDLDLSVKPVDVAALVEEMMGDLGSLMNGHEVEIQTATGAVAAVDPTRFRQVLTNLISNAAKFSPQGSTVEVSVDVAPDRVSVVVQDEGPGIPEGRETELFRPFSRLNRKVPGTGLGLYVSRGIARAHEGELLLEPSAQGARFVFWMPRAKQPATRGRL